jgi:2,4-dienoyl-CoA reductase-like NADH-dependent reductase (Old Yellow Enzyme family)
MYSAVDGFVNDFHLMHYGSLAMKGPGLVIIEAAGVVPEGRITPRDLGIWSDEHIEPLTRLVKAIKSQGAVPGIQIAHAGRKASTSPPYHGDYVESEQDGGWPNGVVGPSDNAFADHYAKPHALTVDEIKSVVQSFADAAVRADKAGIEVLEIHGAHGYLISSFLSGNSNKRTDEYGGSFENRIRLALEVVRAVRAVWPAEKPFWVRISCAEYVNPEPLGRDPEGWDIYQSIELAKRFKEEGVDLIDSSSGGNINGVKYPTEPLYQAQFAEMIKKEANIQTAAVGLIRSGYDGEKVLEGADIALVAREFLRNSSFVQHAAQDLEIDAHWPKQYSWAVNKARRHNKEKIQVE